MAQPQRMEVLDGAQSKNMNRNVKLAAKLLIGLIVGFAIANITPPEGLNVEAMRFMGIFACFVIYLITAPIPDYAAGLLGCSALVIFKVVPITSAFTQFSSDTFMLLIGAFGLGVGIKKSGLINRVTLKILSLFPGTFKGQVLALLVGGTVISPMIPSNLAKMMMAAPIGKGISDKLGFNQKSKGAAGIFSAVWVSFGSAAPLFLSASAWCYIALGLLPDNIKSQVTWGQWFLTALGWGLVVLIGTYFSIMFLYKPEKEIKLPADYVKKQLSDLGPMSRNEKVTAIIILVAVLFWMTEKIHGIPASLVALCALALMVSFKIINSADFKNDMSWDLLIFIGAILSITTLFTPLGIGKWLATLLGPTMEPVTSNIFMFVVVVSLVVYAVRFAIISSMATISVFTLVLMPFAVEAGFNPLIVPFTILVAMNVWYVAFQNPIYMAVMRASDDMTTHGQMYKMGIAYMVLSALGLIACIPIWKILGMLP